MIYLGQDPVGVNSVHSLVIDDNAGNGDTGMTWSADKLTAEFEGKLDASEKGAANGVAGLDVNGKIPSSQLPSYVDDVVEYANLAGFPQIGESGKIYVALDTNKTYRWSGSSYVEISQSLALGETSTTAYRGDRGAAAYAAAVTNVENSPTEDSNNLITSGAVYEGLEAKMNFDPKYGREVAGVANKLLSDKYTEDNTPYLMRKAPDAEFDEECLVGGTVAWNQMLSASNKLLSSYTKYDLTFTPVSGDKYGYSVTGTFNPTSGDRNAYMFNPKSGDAFVAGHKYLILNTSKYFCAYVYGYGTPSAIVSGNVLNVNNQTGAILNCTTAGGFLISVHMGTNIAENTAITETFYFNLFDLTQMFGNTIADYIYTLEQNTVGAGVAFFRNLFPKAYYAYDAGSLQSVQAGSRVVRGFNLLQNDLELAKGWVNGSYSARPAGYMATPEKIPVVPNETYCIYIPNNTALGYVYFAYFDKNQTYISMSDYYTVGIATHMKTFKIPDGVYYISFEIYRSTDWASAETKDVCVNYSSDLNGTYEPYRPSASYPFDTSLTLRGLPKLDNGRLYYDGDEYNADGTVTRRFAIVDLGTLIWARASTSGDNYRFSALISAKQSDTTNGAKSICSRMTLLANAGTWTGSADGYTINSGVIYVYLDAYKTDTAENFKTAMSGVYLVYELATPTTESSAPFTPLQEVFPNGTEQFTEWGTRDVEIPVGHLSKYSNNHKTEIDKDINILYNNKADAIFNSISDAAIANFTDGADDIPVKSMVVDINPVQDLHGQDSPWPGGGGKNKLALDVQPYSNLGVTISKVGESIHIVTNGASGYPFTKIGTIPTTLPSGTYYLKTSQIPSGITVRILDRTVDPPVTISTPTVSLQDGRNEYTVEVALDGANVQNGTYDINVGLMSENIAYAPYSNICPITGWTGAKIVRAGTNILPSSLDFEASKSKNDNGEVVTASGSMYTTSFVGVKPNTQYMFGYEYTTGLNSGRIYYLKKDGTWISRGSLFYGSNLPYAFTTPADCGSIQIQLNITNKLDLDGVSLYVNEGSTLVKGDRATTYPISWQSKAGTVYGGTVDPVNGVLTVTKKSVDLGTLTWTYDPNNAYFYGAVSGIFVPTTNADRLKGIQSSMYPVSTQFSINSTSPDNKSMLTANGSVFIRDSSYSDKDVFKTAMSGVQLVYELATPITYKIDPTTIATLLGTNNIFADTGNVSLTYPCDTKAYIDQNEGVKDVQVNGSSVVQNGVANVPLATNNSVGVGKFPGNDYGVSITNDGTVWIKAPAEARIKAGSNAFSPIVPSIQHISTFYGLAKAAGNTDQSESSNAVGVYTDDAKLKIQQMFGLWTPKKYVRSTPLANDAANIDSSQLPFGDTEINIYEQLVIVLYQSGSGQQWSEGQFNYITIRDVVNNGYVNISSLFVKGDQAVIVRVKRFPQVVIAETVDGNGKHAVSLPRALDYVDKVRWISISGNNNNIKAGAVAECYISRFY